jgi:hypothetical protein
MAKAVLYPGTEKVAGLKSTLFGHECARTPAGLIKTPYWQKLLCYGHHLMWRP